MQKQSDGLDGASVAALADISKVGSTLQDRSRDIAVASKKAAKLITLVSSTMNRQADDLTRASDQASQQIRISGHEFLDGADIVGVEVL